MKKIFTAFLLISLHYSSVFSQTKVFQRVFSGTNDDYANSVVAAADGGYATVGYTQSFGASGMDVMLLKVDSDGTFLWSKIYGGTGNEQAANFVQTPDHGFVICGLSNSYGAGNYDCTLMKTDSAGTLLWLKTYGGANQDILRNLEMTSDSGFILIGSTNSYGQGDYDILVIRTDASGDTLWTKILGDVGNDQGIAATQTSDGGFLVTGRVNSWGSGLKDLYLAKLNSSGDTLWTRVFGTPYDDEGTCLVETFDGNYVVAGASRGTGNFSYDVWLNKVDTAGHLIWSKSYNGNADEDVYCILQLPDSGLIMSGYTESFGSNHAPRKAHGNTTPVITSIINPDMQFLGDDNANVFVIRTDANGDTLWTRTYGGLLLDEAVRIIATNDSGFMIPAYSASFTSDSLDFYLIKTDSLGYSGCNEEPANPTVAAATIIELNTTTQVVSGMTVTNPLTSENPVSATQTDLCFIITCFKKEEHSENNISVYPNPSKGQFTFDFPSGKNFSSAQLGLFNVHGKKVGTFQLSADRKEINIKNLADGIYFYEINFGSNKPARGKIVVMH